MNKIFVLLFLMFSISFGLTSTVPGIVLSDQIGNSLNFAELISPTYDSTVESSHQRVQQNIDDIFVAKNGTVFTRSLYDESSSACGVYKNGKKVGRLNLCGGDDPGQNGAIDGRAAGNLVFVTQRINFADGSSGGFGVSVSVKVNNSYLPAYASKSGGRDRAYFFVRTTGSMPPKAYMTYDEARSRLYVVDYTDTVYVFNEFTRDSMPIRKFYIPNILGISVLNSKLWVIDSNKIKLYDTNGVYQNKVISFIKKPKKLKGSPKNELIVYDDSTNVVYFIKNPGQANQTYRTFGIKNGYYATAGKHKDNALYPNLNGLGVDSIGNVYLSWGWWPTPTNSDLRAFNKTGNLLWRLSCYTFVQNPGFDDRSNGTDIYYMQTRHGINYTKAVAKKDSQYSYTYDKNRSNVPSGVSVGGATLIRWINNRKYMYRTADDLTGQGYIIFKFDGEVAVYMTTINRNSFCWYVDTLGTIWQGDGATLKKYPIQSISGNGDLVYNFSTPITLSPPIDMRRMYYDPTSDDMIVTGYTNEYPNDGNWGTAGTSLVRVSNFSTTKTYEYIKRLDVIDSIGTHWMKDISVKYPYIFAISGEQNPQTVHVYNYVDGTKVGEIYPGREIAGHYNIGVWKTAAHLGWVDMMGGITSTKRSNGEYVILVEDDVNCKTTMYRWCPSGTCDMSK